MCSDNKNSRSFIRHWWLIAWALRVLIILALAEFVPDGQAGRVWLEMINRWDVEVPEPRYVVPVAL